MILKFRREFVEPILGGLKTFTIRIDSNNKWKKGAKIHFATDIARKTYNNFLIGECKSIEIIELEYPKEKLTGRSFGTPIIKIDGFAIPHEEATELAISEGYKNKSELIGFLRLNGSKGKIIHWTIEE